jgi:hypothetical protein
MRISASCAVFTGSIDASAAPAEHAVTGRRQFSIPKASAMLSGVPQLRQRAGGTHPSVPAPGALTPSGPADSHAVMVELIQLQRADGSWDLTVAFARAIGHDLAQLEATLVAATGSREEMRRAWATALALAWLEERARDVEVEWRLLAAKARKWLDRVTSRPAAGGSWAEAGALALLTPGAGR